MMRERRKRYAQFLMEKGEYICPWPWHREEYLQDEEKAADLWKRMERGSGRAFLWMEAANFSRSQYRTETYQNIRLLALVWARRRKEKEESPGISDLLSAFDWMADHGYGEGMAQTDNWWDWQIGMPLALLDCCFLLQDELGEERICRACRTVEHFSGRQTLDNPIFTGANLVWTAMISAMCGILKGDEAEIKEAKRAAVKELRFVEEGDGFYRDGSFIQHEKLAYTGGYGISFLEQMSRMMVLFMGTREVFTAEEYGMLCYFLKHAFFPVTVDGQVMDMVCGREISRHFMKGNRAGKQLMDSMWRIALCADSKTADWLMKRARDWQERKNRPSQFVYFDHMDRAVVRRETYSAGLSLYSSRIQNYEAINGENKKGYHTGSGMLYLYPQGENDFAGDFWCTADMDALPGTTVQEGSRPPHLHVQKSAFVGGVSLESCGAAAMEVTEKEFHVKKSWFFFADSIVCLGNDMRCEAGYLKTTVENRIFSETDETERRLWTEEAEGRTRWMYAGNSRGRGVFFLHPAKLCTVREVRSGTWTDINGSSPDDTVHTQRYLKAWMEHRAADGENPDYAYVLYPVMRKADREEKEQEIEIAAFDSRMHAVWQKREKRIAGVCWDTCGGQVEICDDQNGAYRIRLFGPAVFMAQIGEDGGEIAAKNPLDPSRPIRAVMEKIGSGK